MSKSSKDIKTFQNWLKAAGAEVLKPNTEWELARFRCGEGVGIVYTNKKGHRNFNPVADSAYEAFILNKTWSGKHKKIKRAKRNQHFDTLVERDGKECLFCGTDEDLTLEHIVPLSCEGTNHLSNLALLCEDCNQSVGHMSAAEKFRFGMEVRASV